MNDTHAQITNVFGTEICLLEHWSRCGCDGRATHLVMHESWVKPLPACGGIAHSLARHDDAWSRIAFDSISHALHYGDQRGFPEWARHWIAVNIH